jgi:hypothetical protein
MSKRLDATHAELSIPERILLLRHQRDGMAHTAAGRINRRAPCPSPMPKAQNLVHTQSQAACLIALRHGNEHQPKIERLRKTRRINRLLQSLHLVFDSRPYGIT